MVNKKLSLQLAGINLAGVAVVFFLLGHSLQDALPLSLGFGLLYYKNFAYQLLNIFPLIVGIYCIAKATCAEFMIGFIYCLSRYNSFSRWFISYMRQLFLTQVIASAGTSLVSLVFVSVIEGLPASTTLLFLGKYVISNSLAMSAIAVAILLLTMKLGAGHAQVIFMLVCFALNYICAYLSQISLVQSFILFFPTMHLAGQEGLMHFLVGTAVQVGVLALATVVSLRMIRKYDVDKGTLEGM